MNPLDEIMNDINFKSVHWENEENAAQMILWIFEKVIDNKEYRDAVINLSREEAERVCGDIIEKILLNMVLDSITLDEAYRYNKHVREKLIAFVNEQNS